MLDSAEQHPQGGLRQRAGGHQLVLGLDDRILRVDDTVGEAALGGMRVELRLPAPGRPGSA